MENQEKNSKNGQSQKPPEGIARFSAIIYLILAISVIVVATVGIFSISYDYDPDLPTVELPSEEPSAPPVNQPAETTDTPAGNEQSDVDADIEEPEISYYRPVNGEILKAYSVDKLVFSETMGDYRVHAGLDIAAELGESVVCFADGVIASVEEDYFYGMTVSVEHEGGIVTHYKNLSSELADGIRIGEPVRAGQRIGSVGDTARAEKADKPHLHFEMTVEGEEIDPAEELPN